MIINVLHIDLYHETYYCELDFDEQNAENIYFKQSHKQRHSVYICSQMIYVQEYLYFYHYTLQQM